MFLHDNSKSNQSWNMKLEYIVVYENISGKFDIGYCRTKVKVTVLLGNFSPFTAMQTIRSNNSTLVQAIKPILSLYVCLSDNNIQIL